MATPVLDCPAMELGVTVTNVGDQRGSWTVVRTRAAKHLSSNSKRGQSATVDFAIRFRLMRGSLSELLVLDASGTEVMRRTVTIDCTSEPEWFVEEVVAVDCASGLGGRSCLTIWVTPPALVTVTVADLVSQPARGGRQRVGCRSRLPAPSLGDGRFAYAVHSDSGSVATGELELDCVTPSASAVLECGGVGY